MWLVFGRCAEYHRRYRKCHEEICQCVKSAETHLSYCHSHKVSSLTDCTDQQAKLKVWGKNAKHIFRSVNSFFFKYLFFTHHFLSPLQALSEEVDSVTGLLKCLGEWCPEQGCRCSREGAVSALWRQVARLQRCTRNLKTHSNQRADEWSDITKSVSYMIDTGHLFLNLKNCFEIKLKLNCFQPCDIKSTKLFQPMIDTI